MRASFEGSSKVPLRPDVVKRRLVPDGAVVAVHRLLASGPMKIP
jgi:hypothetical protein